MGIEINEASMLILSIRIPVKGGPINLAIYWLVSLIDMPVALIFSPRLSEIKDLVMFKPPALPMVKTPKSKAIPAKL